MKETVEADLPPYFSHIVQTLVRNYCPDYAEDVSAELWQLLAAIDDGAFCVKLAENSRLLALLPQLGALVATTFLHSSAPLMLDEGFLYLHRTYSLQEELKQLVQSQLIARTGATAFWTRVDEMQLDALIVAQELPYVATAELKRALSIAINSDVLILSGGPGVGKTYSLAVLLRALQTQQHRLGKVSLEVLLLAPTGRAVARMSEAIALHTGAQSYEGQTLHKALGYNPIKGSFARGQENPLVADVIVVDESSMIDAYLFCQLLQALPARSKVILVGDADQLPSVDIGAMFWSLVVDRTRAGHKLADNIVFLTTTYRSSTQILTLALAFLKGDSEGVLKQLQTAKPDSLVRWVPEMEPEALYRFIGQKYGLKPLALFAVYEGGSLTASQQRILDAYFAYFDDFVVLTPINQGAYGVAGINEGVMRLLKMSPHTHGQPLLLTANSSALGLSNGDRGVLVSFGEVLYAVFKQNGAYRLHLPSQLSRYESAFAITVHKSQGSEYSRVLLVMAPSSERVLNGRLTYTALTRAKNEVTLCAATHEIVQATKVMPERTVRLGKVLCPPNAEKPQGLLTKGAQLGLF